MMEAPRQIAFEELRLAEHEDAASPDERFGALVERQARFVFRVAYSVLRHIHAAEDVVQETFLKLYRGRKWQGMVDERAFLARAAWRSPSSRRRRCGVRWSAAFSGNPVPPRRSC